MGGKIGVISDGKSGTVFWFTIRFNQPARNGGDGCDGFLPRTESDSTESSEETSEEDSTPLEVLLVEDNATNQFIAKKILEKIGCRVDIADNGIEAVNAVKTKRYDLVFMDCQMPEMDGYEATKKIRELKGLPGRDDWIPIVAMTAHALSGDREKCLAAGMDDYLVKPLLPDSIAAAIRKWKRKRTPQSDGERTEIFDRRSFFSRIMNDVALARAVIIAFLEDIPAQIELLGKSIEQNDMPSAERFAHRIRGAAANLSCNEISRIARECETAAHDNDAGKTRNSRKQLDEAFRSASKILEALL